MSLKPIISRISRLSQKFPKSEPETANVQMDSNTPLRGLASKIKGLQEGKLDGFNDGVAKTIEPPKPAAMATAVNKFISKLNPENAKAAQAKLEADENYKRVLSLMPPATMKKGGKVSSASKRADGCAKRGKTRGKVV
jgi:hypothetical protein